MRPRWCPGRSVGWPVVGVRRALRRPPGVLPTVVPAAGGFEPLGGVAHRARRQHLVRSQPVHRRLAPIQPVAGYDPFAHALRAVSCMSFQAQARGSPPSRAGRTPRARFCQLLPHHAAAHPLEMATVAVHAHVVLLAAPTAWPALTGRPADHATTRHQQETLRPPVSDHRHRHPLCLDPCAPPWQRGDRLPGGGHSGLGFSLSVPGGAATMGASAPKFDVHPSATMQLLCRARLLAGPSRSSSAVTSGRAVRSVSDQRLIADHGGQPVRAEGMVSGLRPSLPDRERWLQVVPPQRAYTATAVGACGLPLGLIRPSSITTGRTCPSLVIWLTAPRASDRRVSRRRAARPILLPANMIAHRGWPMPRGLGCSETRLVIAALPSAVASAHLAEQVVARHVVVHGRRALDDEHGRPPPGGVAAHASASPTVRGRRRPESFFLFEPVHDRSGRSNEAEGHDAARSGLARCGS